MKSIAILFMKSKEQYGQGVSILRPTLPHPLLALGSYLKDRNVDVYLLDEQICDIKKELEKIINKIDIVAFSVMTMQVSYSLELSDYIKEKYHDKKIIWGGIHPSLLVEQTIKDDSIDYVCQREGEECLYELCNDVPLHEIKNLVYKEKGKIIINPIRDFLDLNKLGMPHWDLLDVNKYINEYSLAGVNAGNTFPITVGRGCTFDCSFCVNTALGRRWRALSVENIIKQIKFLKEHYDIQHFNLNDDCFDIDLERVDNFCKTLIKEKINITWDISVKTGRHWTNERMKLLSDSGCKALSIGAESGSQRILDEIIHKGIKIEDIVFLAEQCNNYGITLISSWMTALPTETMDEQKKTIKLIKKITKICPSCSIHGPQPFKPYPNSELYFEAINQGFETPNSLRDWAEKSEKGYIQDSKLPWVKNPKRLRCIEFSCMNFIRHPRNFLHKQLIILSKFRVKYNFWYLPFEIPLTKIYVSKFIR